MEIQDVVSRVIIYSLSCHSKWIFTFGWTILWLGLFSKTKQNLTFSCTSVYGIKGIQVLISDSNRKQTWMNWTSGSSSQMISCPVGLTKQMMQLAMCVILYDGCINNTLHVETKYLCIISVDLLFQTCLKMMEYSV